MPGFWELVIIFCALLLFFGTKKLPDLAKSLGLGIKEFKKAVSPDDDNANKNDIIKSGLEDEVDKNND